MSYRYTTFGHPGMILAVGLATIVFFVGVLTVALVLLL